MRTNKRFFLPVLFLTLLRVQTSLGGNECVFTDCNGDFTCRAAQGTCPAPDDQVTHVAFEQIDIGSDQCIPVESECPECDFYQPGQTDICIINVYYTDEDCENYACYNEFTVTKCRGTYYPDCPIAQSRPVSEADLAANSDTTTRLLSSTSAVLLTGLVLGRCKRRIDG